MKKLKIIAAAIMAAAAIAAAENDLADMPGVAPEPAGGWKSRGIAIAAPSPADVGRFCAFVKNTLKPAGVDTLVLLVRYRYQFKSHPECRSGDPISLADARSIKAACDAAGIRLIPKMNLLGHQSGNEIHDGLLKGHPELDESPEKKTVSHNYCRSICPTHPDSRRIVLELVDELVDAFGADALHIGCDEVFEIGNCPRCRAVPKSKLFADWVNGIARHLKARGVSTLMWGDRLLDAKATGYGEWEASANGTSAALGMVDKDVAICDWHYENRKAYKSVEVFADAGYKMYLCPWRFAENAQKFLSYAVAHDKGQYLGLLFTTWCGCADFMDAVEGRRLRHKPGSKSAQTLAALRRNFRYLFPAAKSLPGCGGELVLNGGFEDVVDGKTVGWNAVGRKFVYRDGEGRNGTRALCYENDDPSFYSFPGQKIQLKAGHAYEYQVWVKTENLSGEESGATICIEWCNSDGKWLGGAYVNGVKGTKDWTLVKGVTDKVPQEAVTARVNPYVRKGMKGKAWFDDVSVREYVLPPVAGVYSTAYRNMAADGEVTFRAALDVPEDHAGPDLATWFTYQNAKGDVCRMRATNAIGDSVTLSVAELKMGAQRIAAELFDGAKRLGRAEATFTRLDRMPPMATWFDRHGRTIVDGKPFFPLGMYWSAVTTNKIETYAKGPFNCLMPYHAPDSTDIMDLCHAKGLKVIYSVKDIYSGTRWAPKGIKTEADETRYIMDRVSRFKNHPALLAWYLNDELPLSMLPRLAARRDLMEKLDLGHPGWSVLYQYNSIREYMPSFDVVGTDPYPIPDKPAATATEWTRKTMRGTLGCKPVWQVPQAFNWAAYRKTPEEKARCRAPTEAELRSMCWQCIAQGANGLVMYSFFDLEKRPNGEEFERRWAECCRVGAEIRAQFPVLLSDEGADRRIVGGLGYGSPDKDWKGPKYPMSARAWVKDGCTYVLVVNGYDKARHLDVSLLDRRYGEVASVFGPNPKLEHGERFDRLKLDLGPLEPALVCLPRSKK